MADYDGSVKIKITADDKDVNKNASETKASYEKLSKDITNSLAGVTKVLESLNAQLSQTNSNTPLKSVDGGAKQASISIGQVSDKLAKAWDNEKQLSKLASEWQYKLDAISNKDVAPKSISKMESELAATDTQIKQLDADFVKLSSEQEKIANSSFKIDGKTQYASDSDAERMKELDRLIIKNGEDTDALKIKAQQLSDTINNVKANPSLSSEAKDLSSGIDKARARMQELGGSTSHTASTLSGVKNMSSSAFNLFSSGAKCASDGIKKLGSVEWYNLSRVDKHPKI